MSNANIFMIYANAAGNNVTLSPRTGVGERQPTVGGASVTLLSGSGISNNVMTANVRCKLSSQKNGLMLINPGSNCNSWSGGIMSFTDSSSKWIWAHKSGSAVSSDSASASLSQHDTHGTITFNLQTASGGDSVNPFAAAAVNSGTPGTSGGTPTVVTSTSMVASTTTSCSFVGFNSENRPTGRPTGTPGYSCSVVATEVPVEVVGTGPTTGGSSNNANTGANGGGANGGGANSGNSNSNTGASGSQGSFGPGANYNDLLKAHGIILPVAFVLMFPIGAIAIRMLSFPGLVWVHAGWMVLSWLLAIAGMGLGIWLANTSRQLDTAHAIIGIVAVIALLAQPITGLAHHLLFKRHGRPNTATYPHVWWGRAVITLGIINGGLGLQLADNTTNGKIAYAVVAAFMWIVWMTVVVIAFFKSSKRLEGETGETVLRQSSTLNEFSSSEYVQPPMGQYEGTVSSVSPTSPVEYGRNHDRRGSKYNFQ
jgi:hypothetical protein